MRSRLPCDVPQKMRTPGEQAAAGLFVTQSSNEPGLTENERPTW